MGRHTAAVTADAPAAVAARTERPARSGSDAWSPNNPVTDPRLFDAPLPAPPLAPTAKEPQRPGAGSRTPARSDAVPAQVAPRLTASASPATPAATEAAGSTSTSPGGSTTLREIRRATPSPAEVDALVAERYPGLAPARTETPAPATALASAVPLAEAPRIASSAKDSGSPVKDVPPALRRNRAVPLSVSAVAVLGALSAAAVVLPAGHSPAEAADRGTDTKSVPVVPAGATKAKAKAMKAHTNTGRHLGQLKHAASAAVPSATPGPLPRPTAAPPILRPTPTGTVTPTPTPTPPRTATSPSVPTSGTALRSIINGSSNGSLLSLQAARYAVDDFDSDLMALDLQQRGIAGAGVDKTVIELAAHSSTKAGRVPTAAYTTNQLYLLSTIGGTPGLSGFTLRATPQGHLYNGLRIGKAVGARVHDVKIEAVPGNNSFPPGETFVLNDWRTDGSVYSRVTIDGAGVAAAGFGTNSSKNVTINDSTFTGTAYSSGAAIWQTTNITMNDVRIVDNRSGINFERSGGAITLVRPVFKNNARYDMQFGTDLAGGTVTIVDPVLAPGQKLRLNVPAQYHGHTNGQKRSNIHVIVNGVDRTKDLVQYL